MKNNNYEDIINRKYPYETLRKKMSIESRATQFAPFSALIGYGEAINEVTRLTDKKIILSEDSKDILDRKINIIKTMIKEKPQVTITYFIKDTIKEGGKYLSISGNIDKLEYVLGYIQLVDKTKIYLQDIINIESNIFRKNNEL